MDAKTLLLAALVVITLVYGLFWIVVARRKRAEGGHGAHEPALPTPLQTGIGFVTNFFDTLGIGSYATTTAMFRAWGIVRDEKIPGTLNVGHVLPTVVQAIIYTQLVEVEFMTLITMIAAACAGAWLGAGVVCRLPRRGVQMAMGLALLLAATILVAQLTNVLPGGGTALGLSDGRLLAGIAGNLLLGALMTIGIGLYAPCMILISLLGMNPTAAFPIMMGSCAFLMPVASMQFIRKDSYNLRAAIGLALGGPLAVLIAAFIVRSLPLFYVRWLVVFVVIYTATSMLRTASAEKKAAAGRTATQPA